MQQRKNYGWLPQLPDHRDLLFERTVPASNLPAVVDLRSKMPPVVDQGQLGSCTANAIAGAFGYEMLKQSEAFKPVSRLFIYWWERFIEGTTKTDSGAQIRDGIKVVVTQGVCSEDLWPYDISKFAHKPSAAAVKAATGETAIQYLSVTNSSVSTIKSALAGGWVVPFGFTVYESFESPEVAQTGIVPMPLKGESVLGGHAVCCVGYDDTKQAFIVRNSWGATWGLAGYCYMPYSYLTNVNLASDFWVIKAVK